MKRVPPSVRMKEKVEQLLRGEVAEGVGPEVPMEGFMRTLARSLLQVAIEAEATEFLGRAHYRRGRARLGWRNGYAPKRVQTEAGLLDLAVPQLRATAERFQPVLPARPGRRSVDLDGLVHWAAWVDRSGATRWGRSASGRRIQWYDPTSSRVSLFH